MPPALENKIDLRRILSVVSMASSATLLTMILSVVTSKIIALFAGNEGIALMGLFRSLGSGLTGTLSLGSSAIIMARISSASSREKSEEIVGAASLLLLLQLAVIFLLGIFMGKPLAFWLFGGDAEGSHALEVRIVAAMAFVNLAFQTVSAILQGQGELKLLIKIQFASSIATLLLIFPLLSLGARGLAVNVASGSFLGLCLGSFYVLRIYGFAPLAARLSHKWRVLREASAPSPLLIFEGLVLMSGVLAVQAMINRHYSLRALGDFNAAILVINTGVMVLMSSMRSFFLPALGKAKDSDEKEEIQSNMLRALLILGAIGALPLIFAAEPLLCLLFSREFSGAAEILSIFSLSLTGQIFSWSYNNYLLHKGDVRLFVILDSLWAASFTAAVFFIIKIGLPLKAVAWAYVLTHWAGGTLYALMTARRHGAGIFRERDALMAALIALSLLGGYYFSRWA